MDAYIVIGDANSFKSSTVRALTGCRVRGVRALVQRGVVMQTYVQLSSLQEGNRFLKPLDFIREVRKSGANAAIFPLRALRHRGRPDANEYLHEFVKAGWNIKGVAVLYSPDFQLTVPLSRASVFDLPSEGDPHYYANVLASKIRTKFKWA